MANKKFKKKAASIIEKEWEALSISTYPLRNKNKELILKIEEEINKIPNVNYSELLTPTQKRNVRWLDSAVINLQDVQLRLEKIDSLLYEIRELLEEISEEYQ